MARPINHAHHVGICRECGKSRSLDWQGICCPCATTMEEQELADHGTLLERPEPAAYGHVVRQVTIEGCERINAPAQLHLVEG